MTKVQAGEKGLGIFGRSGQGTVEYILILAVVVIGSVALSRTILNALDKGILKLGGQLEKDLKSGRLPLRVWSN